MAIEKFIKQVILENKIDINSKKRRTKENGLACKILFYVLHMEAGMPQKWIGDYFNRSEIRVRNIIREINELRHEDDNVGAAVNGMKKLYHKFLEEE
jgi:hypothetical protein